MASPSISIIVPIYNIAPWLPECLDSIVNQTFQNWEAILVDDGSTDASGQIADGYAEQDARFKVIHQPNSGRGPARNTACDKATGEYLYFLDGDDMVGQTMLAHMYQQAKNRDADMIVGSFYTFRDGSPVNLEHEYPASPPFSTYLSVLPDIFDWHDLSHHFELLYIESPFSVFCGKLLRRALWDKSGCRTPSNLTLSEDFIPIKRMTFSAARIALHPHATLLYRKRAGSATTRRSAEAFDVFKAQPFALDMFREVGALPNEQNAIYRFFLLAIHLHMVNFAPFLLWPRFYRKASQTVAAWPRDITLPYTETRILRLYKANSMLAFAWLVLRYWLIGRILVKIGLRKESH